MLFHTWGSFSGEGRKTVVPPVLAGEFCCFLALNSSLRLAFLRSVEGLGFFLVHGALLLVVSKEKEKEGPTEREKLKTLAEVHALEVQGGVSFDHCSHFGLTSELVKN